MPVSAPERVSAAAPVSAPELRLASCRADIVELAALRGRAGELDRIAGAHGRQLPAFGRIASDADFLALCVRPQRWLLLGAPASPGANAAHWQAACVGADDGVAAGVAAGVAIDLSSALVVLHLGGGGERELLARGCRLDLSAEAFPPGSAAATVMVQVSVILAALPSGVLLLTPASTARHLREWLAATARSLGQMPSAAAMVAELTLAEVTVAESTAAEPGVAESTGDPR